MPERGGRRHHPEEIRDAFLEVVDQRVEGAPVASIGHIKELNETTRRAKVEAVPDGTVLSNVPVAEPYARPGVGDISPVNPDHHDTTVSGILLYVHHPMDDQLASHGEEFNGERDRDSDDAVFLPAMLWFDGDEVPEHDPGDRIIGHDSGARMRLGDDETELEGGEGGGVSVEHIPEPEDDAHDIFGEEFKADRESWEAEVGIADTGPDNTTWPIAEEGDVAVTTEHPEGIRITETDRGIAIEIDEEINEVSIGPLNDGTRRPLDGAYQHTHLLETADGPMLVGEHLTFREWVYWLTDGKANLVNGTESWIEEASIFAQAYLDWLEDELGRTIDPSDPDDWPDPEPMPTPEQRSDMT